jgi:AcrR family transcriptional regulator
MDPKAGRPRNEASRCAILAAALKLARTHGYAEISMDGIAAEAGTGKQTIYRWWPSKAAVVLDALQENARAEIETPNLGTLRADLEIFLKSTFAVNRRRPSIDRVLRAMMAEAQHDEKFADAFKAVVIEPRRAALRLLLKRSQKRKETKPGANCELMIDVIFGVMWYRLLAGVGKIDAELAGQLTSLTMKAMN